MVKIKDLEKKLKHLKKEMYEHTIRGNCLALAVEYQTNNGNVDSYITLAELMNTVGIFENYIKTGECFVQNKGGD